MSGDMTVHEAFWLGYRNGARACQYLHHITDHEPALKLDVHLTGTTNKIHRAFALGELRGYRQARND